MKDKLLQIRVDDDFLLKLEYLQKINGFKTVAETIRKIIEKEYRKEIYNNVEVVRCKNCKHYSGFHTCLCENISTEKDEDFFCAYGESNST